MTKSNPFIQTKFQWNCGICKLPSLLKFPTKEHAEEAFESHYEIFHPGISWKEEEEEEK